MRRVTTGWFVGMISGIMVLGGCSAETSIDQLQSELGGTELNPLPRHLPINPWARGAHGGGGGSSTGKNLVDHGGPTITNAHVVPIFWGSEWGFSSSPSSLATSLTWYVSAFGTTGEYNTITQYSGIQKSNLLTNAYFDNTNPPTNVTDADIQAEVLWTLDPTNPDALPFDPDAIYEVFLPSTSYSSDGSSTSCGGPNLAYCAYHWYFTSGSNSVRYASMPYPGCGGCQTSGFTVAQNLEHFISHETREAVTDPEGTAWWDRRGYEADDKCAWKPSPFGDASTGSNLDGSAFAYQYEWSNLDGACVKTR